MEKKTVKETFWEQLPIKMAAARIKPVDLAQALNLSKSTISCWIHRKSFPEMDNVQQIAKVLGCTTDELLGRIPEAFDPDFDRILAAAYHAADPNLQTAVRKLLDITLE